MNLLESLLAERARILGELADVESLLKSRCGWVPDSKSDEGQTNECGVRLTGNQNVEEKHALKHDDSVPIAYRSEAKEWLAQENRPLFSARNFRDWLAEKYGNESINDQSVRSPLPLLVSEGLIEIVTEGAGRRPTTYRKKINHYKNQK